MLFAPDAVFTITPHPLWATVQALAPRLVSREATRFLRYCRQQSERYGSKGARAGAARRGLTMLKAAEAAHGSTTKLASMGAELAAFTARTPHTGLLDLPVGNDRIVRHLDLCGRKVRSTPRSKAAREMAARLLAEYGARKMLAEHDGGVDRKALSHAVRIGQEAPDYCRWASSRSFSSEPHTCSRSSLGACITMP